MDATSVKPFDVAIMLPSFIEDTARLLLCDEDPEDKHEEQKELDKLEEFEQALERVKTLDLKKKKRLMALTRIWK